MSLCAAEFDINCVETNKIYFRNLDKDLGNIGLV